MPGSRRRSPTSITVGRSIGPAAGEGAEPGEELLERERLGEVVVGPGIEAAHAVLDRVAGGEHQHGRPPALGPQGVAHGEPVGLGDHGVEHDGVVVLLAGRPQRLVPVAGDVDRVALALEAPAHEGCHLHLVLDHQHAHAAQGNAALMRQMRGALPLS